MKIESLSKETLNSATFCGEPAQLCDAGRWRIKGLATFSDAGGLRGWQWLFLVETVPSILLGFMILIFLDNRVADARWLTDAEKEIVASQVAQESAQSSQHTTVMDAIKSARVWLLGLAYFCIASSIYVISFWLPTLIKLQGVSDPQRIGWLITIPYTVAIIAMVWCNVSADRHGERRWHTAIPCLVTALALPLTNC